MSWIDKPDSGGNAPRKTIGMPRRILANAIEEGWGGVEKSEEQAERRYKGGVEPWKCVKHAFLWSDDREEAGPPQ